jgi:hypothetical protein
LWNPFHYELPQSSLAPFLLTSSSFHGWRNEDLANRSQQPAR